MGIRFACHECDKRLNVKRDLAGKRGICPSCSTRFRIPLVDAERSTPVEDSGVHAVNHHTDHLSHSGRVAAAPAPETNASRSRSDVVIAPMLDEATATWFVRPPSGGQYGPASSAVLRSWIDQNRVAATSWLWRDGWPQWRLASDVFPELIDSDLQVSQNQTSAAAEAPPSVLDKPELASRLEAEGPLALAGRADLGGRRRARSSRRTLMIAALVAVALTLIFALVIVINRG